MKDSSINTVIVECLSISHLQKLASKKERNEFRFLNLLLLRGWLAKIENALPRFIARKQPFCLVALENQQLIASIIIKPINNRGTCWSISRPIIFTPPKINSIRRLKMSLIKASLDLNVRTPKNWVVKYPSNNNEELSIARELGFQPQKLISCWSINSTNKYKILSNRLINPYNYFAWENLNHETAYQLAKLEKVCDSVLLREIFDLQPFDLINNNKYVKVYLSKSVKSPVVIAGIIQQDFPYEKYTLKITRDITWDSRLKDAITEIMKDICNLENDVLIEVNKDDDQINKLLADIGLTFHSEHLLLGKSNLKRKEFQSNFPVHNHMEAIFGKLQPGDAPLPSPTGNTRYEINKTYPNINS